MAAFGTISELVGIGSSCRQRLRETDGLLLRVGDDRGIFLGLGIVSGEDFTHTTLIFYLRPRSAPTSA